MTRDGARLAVQESGTPDGPALLLLQGQSNSHDFWTGLRDRLAGFRTITFDYRGTGESRGGASDGSTWSTRSFAEDARAVLDACGVPTAHVYGASMGGRVAQMLAIDAPGRVDRLVLACSSPGGAVAQERTPTVRLSLAQADPAARERALLDLMYTPQWQTRGASSHLLGDTSMTPRARMLHLRVSAEHDAADALGRITAPTLVLHGDDDLMTPVVNAPVIAQRIRRCELVIRRGGRHGFFDEFAQETCEQVAAFLAA